MRIETPAIARAVEALRAAQGIPVIDVSAAGLVPDFRDGAAFRDYIRIEIDKWGRVVREAKIKID